MSSSLLMVAGRAVRALQKRNPHIPARSFHSTPALAKDQLFAEVNGKVHRLTFDDEGVLEMDIVDKLVQKNVVSADVDPALVTVFHTKDENKRSMATNGSYPKLQGDDLAVPKNWYRVHVRDTPVTIEDIVRKYIIPDTNESLEPTHVRDALGDATFAKWVGNTKLQKSFKACQQRYLAAVKRAAGGLVDKRLCSVMLLEDGPGTGKSRAQTELAQMGKRMIEEELDMKTFMVLTSFGNGTEWLRTEDDPLTALGVRMLGALYYDRGATKLYRKLEEHERAACMPEAVMDFVRGVVGGEAAFVVAVDELNQVAGVPGKRLRPNRKVSKPRFDEEAVLELLSMSTRDPIMVVAGGTAVYQLKALRGSSFPVLESQLDTIDVPHAMDLLGGVVQIPEKAKPFVQALVMEGGGVPRTLEMLAETFQTWGENPAAWTDYGRCFESVASGLLGMYKLQHLDALKHVIIAGKPVDDDEIAKLCGGKCSFEWLHENLPIRRNIDGVLELPGVLWLRAADKGKEDQLAWVGQYAIDRKLQADELESFCANHLAAKATSCVRAYEKTHLRDLIGNGLLEQQQRMLMKSTEDILTSVGRLEKLDKVLEAEIDIDATRVFWAVTAQCSVPSFKQNAQASDITIEWDTDGMVYKNAPFAPSWDLWTVLPSNKGPILLTVQCKGIKKVTAGVAPVAEEAKSLAALEKLREQGGEHIAHLVQVYVCTAEVEAKHLVGLKHTIVVDPSGFDRYFSPTLANSVRLVQYQHESEDK